MTLFLILSIMAFCLAVEFFFAGTELAMVAADRIRLRHRAEAGGKGEKLALELLERPEWLMATTLTCHNVAFVTNVTLGTVLILQWVGPQYGELVTLLILSPFLLVLGEIVPKSLFQQQADRIAPKAAYVVWFASRLLYPVIFLISRVTGGLLRRSERENLPFVTREELNLMLQTTSRGGDVKAEERRMIHRIFTFGNTTAREAMVPMVEVVAVPETASVEDIVAKMEEKGYSRIPVYQERVHNIVGVVNVFDVLTLSPEEQSPKGIVQPVYYVPESMRADDLLRALEERGENLAVVVDEYGGSIGIVTVEDLLEEIVGEIQDEFETEIKQYYRLPDGSFLIKARMEVDAINEELGLQIPKGSYETLAGYITTHLERIPRPGEVLRSSGLELTVVYATSKSVKEVRVRRLPPEAGQARNS